MLQSSIISKSRTNQGAEKCSAVRAVDKRRLSTRCITLLKIIRILALRWSWGVNQVL